MAIATTTAEIRSIPEEYRHHRIFRVTPQVLIHLLNPSGGQIVISEGWPSDAKITGISYRPYPDDGCINIGIETEEGFNDDYGYSWRETFTPGYSFWNSCPGCNRRFTDTLDAILDQAK